MPDLTRAQQIDAAWQQHTQPALDRIALRTRLAEAQNWRCCYCGTRMEDCPGSPHSATIEHVHPRCRGGSNAESNLVVACWTCNGRMGDVPVWRKWNG